MSESLILHCQEYFDVLTANSVIDNATVTGLELPGQPFLRGTCYNPDAPEVEIPLSWDAAKAERLAAYYERHLVTKDEDASGWNCHSFVAAIMGWEVAWNKDAIPYHMPVTPGTTNPSQLQDQQAYGISRPMRIPEHSVIGMPNPDFNISVSGFRQPLRIMSNKHALLAYPGRFHRYIRPVPGVNRMIALLPTYSKQPPVHTAHSVTRQ